MTANNQNDSIHAQLPGHVRDVDVPQYYVWGMDDSSTGELYWVIDSTRDDLEVAGPLDFVSAIRLSARLNDEGVELERSAAERDQPLPGRIYGLTGAVGERCLLNTGSWAASEVDP